MKRTTRATYSMTWQSDIKGRSGLQHSSCQLLLILFLTLVGLGLLAVRSPVHAQAPCLANFTSPLFIPVNGQLTDVLIDDQCEHIYLTNASNNQIDVFSLRTLSLGLPITVGSLPTGLDTSPDGGTLYVANSGGNNISIVDLKQGIEILKVPVVSGFLNDTPFSIAVAQSGLVLFSTTFAGSGFGGRMLQLDPASNTVSQRTDFWFGGTTTEVTRLKASGDRSAIGIVAGDISSGPVFKYTSVSNSFTPEKDLNAFVAYIALDQMGTVALVNPGTYVLDSNLNLSGTIPGGSFGVAVDPVGAIGYQVGGSNIDVLDLKDFTKTGSLAIGDSVANANTFGFGSVGQLAISRDGTVLAVITDHGFSVVQSKISRSVPFAAIDARAHIRLRSKPDSDSFNVEGKFTLNSHSDGIDPLTENVMLQIGSFAGTIPAGSFTQRGCQYNFEGTIDGVLIRILLQSLSHGRFLFAAHGEGADLTGTSFPMTVGLGIGDDNGSTKLTDGEADFTSK